MKLKEEYNRLVKSVKANAKESGNKIKNEEIAKRLGFTKSYFSELLKGSLAVKEEHIEGFKAYFSKELSGDVKPAPAWDSMNRERALIKVLLHEVAKLKSAATGAAIEVVLAEFEKDTRDVMNELND
ncbi:hypothetical protein GO495_04045 [Chitinophaga oryziterrae]|uniref:Uncharacterized protein n=1 Tax=Chitinophaga oryziterrae TaxID=1031224 RepID=A0A6N8J4A9_9BACT|nr:hypothetical protein [Chitinophaga oryziterrae]MVT39744.1 hypothetical protein [Chitinophaga oryziterrae]